jgi:hypothetical protein
MMLVYNSSRKLMKVLLLALLSVFHVGSAFAQASGTIRGRLLSSDGSPAYNVRVALSPAGDRSAASTPGALSNITQTDSSGRYRMEQVPSGRYYVLAGLVDNPTYYPGAVARESATPLLVAAGTVLEVTDFRLINGIGLRINGRVELEGVPANRAQTPLTVRLTGGSPRVFTTANVAANGSFEFSGLRPGQYSLTVQPNISMAPVPVTLADKDLDGFQLKVPRSAIFATVNGKVIVDGGGMLPWFQVILTNTAGPQRGLQDGERRYGIGGPTFSIGQVPAGEYTVSLRDLAAGFSVKSLMLGSKDLLVEKLDLSPTDQPEIAIVLGVSSPPPWVRVRGRVVDIDGLTVPTTIKLFGGGLVSALTAAVSMDGTFEFPQALPGTYTASFMPSIDSFDRSIVVSKDNPAVIEVPLSFHTVRVAGTIVGEDELRRLGRLPANTTITPRLLRGDGRGNLINSARLTRRDPDGSFEFSNVQAGSYRLVLSRSYGGDVSDIAIDNAVPFVVTDKDVTGLVIQAR